MIIKIQESQANKKKIIVYSHVQFLQIEWNKSVENCPYLGTANAERKKNNKIENTLQDIQGQYYLDLVIFSFVSRNTKKTLVLNLYAVKFMYSYTLMKMETN